MKNRTASNAAKATPSMTSETLRANEYNIAHLRDRLQVLVVRQGEVDTHKATPLEIVKRGGKYRVRPPIR